MLAGLESGQRLEPVPSEGLDDLIDLRDVGSRIEWGLGVLLGRTGVGEGIVVPTEQIVGLDPEIEEASPFRRMRARSATMIPSSTTSIAFMSILCDRHRRMRPASDPR